MKTLFIANRGEIALRILRTAQSLGYRVAVACPEIDRGLPYALSADIVLPLGSPAEFTSIQPMVDAARLSGAEVVHPGYGFLSENAGFARAVRQAGMSFVGPSAAAIETLGDKGLARQIAASCGIPTVEGSEEPLTDFDDVARMAGQIGFPVMLKAVAGGGGIGMEVAHTHAVLRAVYDRVASRAAAVFGDARLIVERFVERSRHVEIQLMGLPNGEVIALAERDCSVQRRHQKVIEESPSPVLDETLRESMSRAAVTIAKVVGYENAGTVEFLFDLDRRQFYFLEMNTRLQVEHPVTEAVHGVDFIAWQLDIIDGSSAVPSRLAQGAQGHSIELRVYAEDSEKFLPRPGRIVEWTMPRGEGIRVDSGYTLGNEVTPMFDPLVAKIIVVADTREGAIECALKALATTKIVGPGTNVRFLTRVLRSSKFSSGKYSTGLVVA